MSWKSSREKTYVLDNKYNHGYSSDFGFILMTCHFHATLVPAHIYKCKLLSRFGSGQHYHEIHNASILES